MKSRHIAILLLTVSLLPAAAFAQDRSADRLERLERDMTTLQAQVYRGGGAPMKTADGKEVDPGIMAQQQQFQASIEVRLSQLEESIRQMNGRLEEMEFNNKKQAEDLKKLSEDVDFRFNQLKQGGGTPAALPATTGSSSSSGGNGSKVLGTVVVDPEKDEFVKGKSTAAKDKGDPKSRYDAAFALLRQSKYPEAEKAFNAFILDFPEHELAAPSYYWLGETYFVRKDYEAAAVEFLKGYRKAPTGAKAPDSLLKLGTSLGLAKKDREACTVFGKLSKEFPNAAAPVKRKAELERTRLKCN